MRRTMAGRDFLHVKRVTLTTAAPSATVSIPLANDFRVGLAGVLTDEEVLFRNVAELETGIANPADTAALSATNCSQLDAYRPDSGWIPAQSSALRFKLTAGASADVIVEYTSRDLPVA